MEAKWRERKKCIIKELVKGERRGLRKGSKRGITKMIWGIKKGLGDIE